MYDKVTLTKDESFLLVRVVVTIFEQQNSYRPPTELSLF